MVESIVECESCSKNDVCKYKEKRLEIIQFLKEYLAEDETTSVKISCHYYSAPSFNYKTPG